MYYVTKGKNKDDINFAMGILDGFKHCDEFDYEDMQQVFSCI